MNYDGDCGGESDGYDGEGDGQDGAASGDDSDGDEDDRNRIRKRGNINN